MQWALAPQGAAAGAALRHAGRRSAEAWGSVAGGATDTPTVGSRLRSLFPGPREPHGTWACAWTECAGLCPWWDSAVEVLRVAEAAAEWCAPAALAIAAIATWHLRPDSH